jgi:hypothetical protein
MYRQLNIHIVLVGVEVWTRGNLINMTDNAYNTMNNFLEYRRTKINPQHPNDNAQLITLADRLITIFILSSKNNTLGAAKTQTDVILE